MKPIINLLKKLYHTEVHQIERSILNDILDDSIQHTKFSVSRLLKLYKKRKPVISFLKRAFHTQVHQVQPEIFNQILDDSLQTSLEEVVEFLNEEELRCRKSGSSRID